MVVEITCPHCNITGNYDVSEISLSNAILLCYKCFGSITISAEQAHLVQLGEVEWAGICSNFPILAAALLAGSTCTTTQQAMRTTTQHVYMLAYQTWPSMAFIGVIWAAEGALGLASIALGSISVIIVLAIQYTMIKNEL